VAYSINSVTICGKIGRDAETRQAGNSAVTSFYVATDRSFKKGDQWEKETTWHTVKAWNADRLAPSLTKGSLVTVRGRLSIREYEKDGVKKQAVEIVADDICIDTRGRDNYNPPAASKPDAEWGGASDDDIPF
jgi:single-strand DNA-binding protein